MITSNNNEMIQSLNSNFNQIFSKGTEEGKAMRKNRKKAANMVNDTITNKTNRTELSDSYDFAPDDENLRLMVERSMGDQDKNLPGAASQGVTAEFTNPNPEEAIPLPEGAMEERSQTRDPIALTMDSTAVIEFQFVDNVQYSQQIITAARAAFDLGKLDALKHNRDLGGFYEEARNQITVLWRADQALVTHSGMFSVLFMIDVGTILNKIEPTFRKKSQYTAWLKANFELKHIRYLQQAKQLAAMGGFARVNAAAGKNRLLVLDHLRKVENLQACEALLADHPLPEMTEDEDGVLLKRHIDSIISLHRLRRAGVTFASLDQATLIASYNQEALTVKVARQVSAWLSQQPEDQRPALFNRYVQDQLNYPSDHPYTPAPKASLNKVLADLINGYGTECLEDEAWIARQRELNILDSLLSAQRLIDQLIERIAVTDKVPPETQAV